MRRPSVMTLIAALVVAGCGTGSAPPSATPAATARATEPPMATAPSTPAALATRDPNEPPPASLATEGGDPVTGQLGSFTWGGGGSDSPWLPGAPIHVGTGERLSLTVADAVKIDTWSVRRIEAGISPPEPIPMAEGRAEPVSFVAPPPGRWSVQADVRFGGDTGSAAYYWLIEVD